MHALFCRQRDIHIHLILSRTPRQGECPVRSLTSSFTRRRVPCSPVPSLLDNTRMIHNLTMKLVYASCLSHDWPWGEPFIIFWHQQYISICTQLSVLKIVVLNQHAIPTGLLCLSICVCDRQGGYMS